MVTITSKHFVTALQISDFTESFNDILQREEVFQDNKRVIEYWHNSDIVLTKRLNAVSMEYDIVYTQYGKNLLKKQFMEHLEKVL